jgi:hypothetical protein
MKADRGGQKLDGGKTRSQKKPKQLAQGRELYRGKRNRITMPRMEDEGLGMKSEI